MASKHLYGIWAEWDLGQDRLVFWSEEAAISWLQEAIELDEPLIRDYPGGAEEVINLGLACTFRYTLV